MVGHHTRCRCFDALDGHRGRGRLQCFGVYARNARIQCLCADARSGRIDARDGGIEFWGCRIQFFGWIGFDARDGHRCFDARDVHAGHGGDLQARGLGDGQPQPA